MRWTVLALVLGACGRDVIDPQCRHLDDVAACTQCCLDQGYTQLVEVDGDRCVCSRMEVGDDPGEADLRR
jgi:hypothetical protein